MKRKSIYFLISFIFIVTINFQASFAQNKVNKDSNTVILRWVEKANSQKDAEKSIKINDFRFLAVSGFRLDIPGIPIDKQKILTTKYGYKIIEGTTEILEGEEHLRLIKLVNSYASNYNIKLFDYLTNFQSDSCKGDIKLNGLE